MTEEEKLAQAWLRSRGYEAEYEPTRIVTGGRCPDFLATGAREPPKVWAEVKTLGLEDTRIAMDDAWEVIQTIALPTDLKGFGTLFVNAGTQEQSVRAVLKLFSEHGPKYKDEAVELVFSQQVAHATGMRRIDINGHTPPQHFWIRGAGDQKVSAAPGVVDAFSLASFKDGDEQKTLEAYRIFEWGANAPLNCALVVKLNTQDHPLSIHPMSGGFVTVGGRVLRALESANGQLKNGCRYLEAPGVIFIVPPEHEHADDFQIAAGAYGKLMMSIPVGREAPESSSVQHGPDAAFQSGKNRHISVAIRLNRDGNAGMFFPNPYAHRPVAKDSALLRGLVCYPPAINLE